ncbi:hypothetical protein MY5147_007382 [Beauveria neobassiana]
MDFDQASVDAAMQAQEAKRKAALEQHATGDTHWVLNTKFEKSLTGKPSKVPRKIVYVGYGDIDSENESGDGEDVAANGRTSTHKPKPKNESAQNPSDDESGDESGQGSDDSEESQPRKRKDTGPQREQSRSRSKSRTRPTAAEVKAKELRDKRRKKEFGIYVMFPIGIMYYFGTNLDNRFSVPDFWPRPEECNKLPRDRDELKIEYERMLARQRFKQARFEEERAKVEGTAGAGNDS